MANPAGLDADTYMSGRRVNKRTLSDGKNARARNFDSFIFSAHKIRAYFSVTMFKARSFCFPRFVFHVLVTAFPPINDYSGVVICRIRPGKVASVNLVMFAAR